MTVRYDSGMAGGFSFPIHTPQRQYMVFNDFNGGQNYDADESITLTQATSGTMAQDLTVHGGAVLFDAGANTDGQGVNVQMGDTIVLDEAADLFFECRVRFATTAGTSLHQDETFIGLAQTGTTAIVASDAMADIAFLGFSSCSTGNPTTTAGHMQLCSNVSSSGTGSGVGATHVKIDTAANSGVGVDDFVRLGIALRNGEAQAFVNGEKVGDPITSNLPTSLVLEPSFVCQANGTRAKYIVDYYMVTCSRSSTAL